MAKFGKSEAEKWKREEREAFWEEEIVFERNGFKREERRTMKGIFISSLDCDSPLVKGMVSRGRDSVIDFTRTRNYWPRRKFLEAQVATYNVYSPELEQAFLWREPGNF